MTRYPAALKSIPRADSIATLLTLTNHGTTGAVTNQGSAKLSFESLEDYHEGVVRIELKSTGGVGATPTAVGAAKTFTLKYAFSDYLINLTDAPTVFASVVESLVCSLPNAVSVQATGVLTFTGNAANGDHIVIGSRHYKFYAAVPFLEAVDPSDPAYAGSEIHADAVAIGATADDTATNLIHAIMGTGTPGTHYHENLSTPNTEVTAATGGASIVNLTAIVYGTDGNLETTEVVDDGSNFSFGAATLTGGSAAGTRVYATDPEVHRGKYLYTWYDRTAFDANAKIDVEAKLVRL